MHPEEEISYLEIEAIVLEKVPEIRDEYYSYGFDEYNSPYPTDEWIQELRYLPISDPRRVGATIVFESILTPYIVSILEDSEKAALVHEILDWIELLAGQEDLRIKHTLVGVCFCEQLLELTNKRPELLLRIFTHLGDRTREICYIHSESRNLNKISVEILKNFLDSTTE